MAMVVAFHVPEVTVPTEDRLEAVVSPDKVVKVELLVAVIFAAVPLVLAALFGISALTNDLKVGWVATPVVGPANTVFAD